MMPLAFTSPLMLFGACGAAGALDPAAPDPATAATRSNSRRLRLILDLIPTEETPARTPWWLTALRLGDRRR